MRENLNNGDQKTRDSDFCKLLFQISLLGKLQFELDCIQPYFCYSLIFTTD